MIVKTKASMVVFSHLSDAQEIMIKTSGVEAAQNINFCKFIILECNGDLNQEIDADTMYYKFLRKW